jgi:hypothetical protein
LNYPVYLIASEGGVVVIRVDDCECVMLYHTSKLAEREIENIQSTHPQLGRLRPLAVPSRLALREGLAGLPAEITCVIWDPLGSPTARMGLAELLQSL